MSKANKKGKGSNTNRGHTEVEMDSVETDGIADVHVGEATEAAAGASEAPVGEPNTSGEQTSKARRPGRPKEDVTYVPVERLLAVVEEEGLKVQEKAAWLRIDGPHVGRVYLPRRKLVGRVDIAGMEAPQGTSVKLGDKSFGAVKEQLDMKLPEELVLTNFRSLLRHMASLPAAEQKQVETAG